LLIILGIFLFRRYRWKQHEMEMLKDESVEDGIGGMSREEALTVAGAAGDAAMRQTPLGMSPLHDQSRHAANDSDGVDGAAAVSVVDPFQGPITGAGDGESTSYQTLPSYHEQIIEAQSQYQASHAGEDGGYAARQLSQADINAISQRLTEMMRTYIRQNGGNPDALSSRIIVPPRELIDHLVGERLNPREVP
jgi:hypothetical protein